jgi:pyruvate dehydrogenase E2 component (dihydrolipoamide acetyltransferase)
MAIKVIMPKQGLQMTEGIITRWLYREGQTVKQGEPLFEMETDKLSIEIDAPASGTLLKIIHDEGDTVPITETIALIGEPGETLAKPEGEADETAREATGRPGESPERQAGTHAEAAAKTHDEAAAKTHAEAAAAGRVFATPRARALAKDLGLRCEEVRGTGPEGIIIEKDILQAAQEMKNRRGQEQKQEPRPEQKKEPVAGGQSRLIPLSGKRKVIAERLTRSLREMAQANHRMKVNMTEIIRLREKLLSQGSKVSFTDILIKAAARALPEFPMINSSLTPDGILLKDEINIGVAVATDDGLMVPVIKDAARRSLREIASLNGELAEKARQGRLTSYECSGGTFTITNLGMFDIDEFTAIINPPESAILAIGKIEKTPVVEGDGIVIRPIMTMSLTYDHRVIDGAPAARFLQKIKEILLNPDAFALV